jgi:anthranilate phosphoribosyltransferase
MLDPLTLQVATGGSLDPAQVRAAVVQLTDEQVSIETKAAFLTALARKGETPEEIAAFARELRERAVMPPIDPTWRGAREILDVVGTGGDRLSTFNISTTVALLAAAAGVAVAKHGNRAVTSSVGSADVMEALGLPFDLGPEDAARALREHGFAFFFAPKYHPAFRHIAPARKLCAERGQRTIFNFLGPLLNPAQPTAALIGVPRPELCQPLARVLQSLGMRRAMVVCGLVPPVAADVSRRNGGTLPVPNRGLTSAATNAFLDELSTLGANTVAEFYQERGLTDSTFDPTPLPLQPATLGDLRGGDREVNAAIIRGILRGEDRGPRRDAVLLNAGAALFVAGAARSIADGWELAAAVIDDGQARRKLDELTRA